MKVRLKQFRNNILGTSSNSLKTYISENIDSYSHDLPVQDFPETVYKKGKHF